MMKKIYVFCPNDIVTGGPDALHQIVFYLNQLGFDAKIVYYAFSQKHCYSIPDAYRNYILTYITEQDFVDSPNNIVILPEHAVDKLKFIKKSKVYIWWLSVDNNRNKSSILWKLFYFATLPARVVKNFEYYRHRFGEAIVKTIKMQKYSFKSEPENVEHLCASFYAHDYVSQRSPKKVNLCIEPISKFFLNSYEKQKQEIRNSPRSNNILYNPRKSGAFVQKLAALAPELSFEPLVGLNQEQLIKKYCSSKLYVDFGPFPGAERMPKEAVLFGCNIITGRYGASNFYGDVPIPDEYKFTNPQKETALIIKKIKDSLKNYNEQSKDFDLYRKTVLELEDKFIQSLKELFV